MTPALYSLLIGAYALERLAEMMLTRRNAAWSFGRGGVEYGQSHWPVMVVLHTTFLLACPLEVWLLQRPFLPSLGWPMLALCLAAQAIRWWVIWTLGPRWNARVIVVPGLPRITGGPYRWLRHPNYVAVVVEGFALPLVHSAWWTAAAFSITNALLLAVRLRVEEEALRTLPGHEPRPTRGPPEMT